MPQIGPLRVGTPVVIAARGRVLAPRQLALSGVEHPGWFKEGLPQKSLVILPGHVLDDRSQHGIARIGIFITRTRL